MNGFERYGSCLNNALYGLQQASRERNEHINKFVLDMGGNRRKADLTLPLLCNGKNFVLLVVYVDNVMLIRNLQSTIEKGIEKFSKSFEVGISRKMTGFFGNVG